MRRNKGLSLSALLGTALKGSSVSKASGGSAEAALGSASQLTFSSILPASTPSLLWVWIPRALLSKLALQ